MAYINRRHRDNYRFMDRIGDYHDLGKAVWYRDLSEEVDKDRMLEAYYALRGAKAYENQTTATTDGVEWQSFALHPADSRKIAHILRAAGWRQHS